MSSPSYCAYPWQQMIIDLTGEVVPCCFWSGYGNTGRPLGNTNVNSIDEIWNGPGYQALRQANASGDLSGHPCHECMAYSWSNGLYPPFESPITWRHESGHCHLCEIPEPFLQMMGSHVGEARVVEDGAPLAMPDAVHDDIRRLGAGRYSVWGSYVYFSSSDNSDPAYNGRTYELQCGPHRVKLAGIELDSPSGRNIALAHNEYRDGATVMEARPTMISLISTADCNIDCPGCSQNTVRLTRVQHRSETVPDVLAHVPYLYQFIWHGGEPYLIKRFREFIDTFETGDNPNLTFGFTSNGTMLTRRELQKLDKFPRINASISFDSFNKPTFELIRKGARYELVLENLLRAVSTYRNPERVFSAGMIVCKSNFLELPDNIAFAIEHDIGLNLSPVLIYPVTEQLNVFEDFHAQTAGWQEALDRAVNIVQRAKSDNRVALSRVNPEGMLLSLQGILQRARRTYESCVEIEIFLEDPHGSLSCMEGPALFAYLDGTNSPLAYSVVRGSGIQRLRVPATARMDSIYWRLSHRVMEPNSDVVSGRPRPAAGLTGHRMEIPRFRLPSRPRNITYASYGETTDAGLVVRSTSDIDRAYGELARRERLEGLGAESPLFWDWLRRKASARLESLRRIK